MWVDIKLCESDLYLNNKEVKIIENIETTNNCTQFRIILVRWWFINELTETSWWLDLSYVVTVRIRKYDNYQRHNGDPYSKFLPQDGASLIQMKSIKKRALQLAFDNESPLKSIAKYSNTTKQRLTYPELNILIGKMYM